MGMTCQQCGQTLPPRSAKYCSVGCRNGAKLGKRLPGRTAQYDELQWLIDQRVEVFEALARCGIPTARCAYRWARRHQRDGLAAALRHAYNHEMREYARERALSRGHW